MKWQSLGIGMVAAGVLLLTTEMLDAVEVKNVTAVQRWPWNGKVDIQYEVAEAKETNTPLAVTMTDRMEDATNTIEAEACALSGDTGSNAGTHRLTWDLDKQGIKLQSTNVVFTVIYDPLYCVVDLSGGTNALSYPVAYMNEPPSGGFNTDTYKTTKLVLRRVDSGSFAMGGEYQVTLSRPFYMGIFEVTQKQWTLVMGSNPSSIKEDRKPVELVNYDMIRGSAEGANWPASSAVDASSFLGKLRAKTGIEFDLPTEAQWEYACRAGTTSYYNNGGNTTNDLKQLGRYCDNRFDGNGGSGYHYSRVGSYLPNAWGLYDMHGNVWEWCLDWYGNLTSGVTDPKGSPSGSYRVVRGGSYENPANVCTSEYRHLANQSYSYEIYTISCGFRLVKTLPE